MKHLVPALALILVGSAAAKAADINFGETRTRFQIRNELTAWERQFVPDLKAGPGFAEVDVGGLCSSAFESASAAGSSTD